MKIRRKKGFFSISAVAKMFSVHQQTVRLYEKQGLINPKRSSGNTRLFSEEDIDQLEEVIYLTHEMGINLAGVENEKSKEMVQSSYQRLLQLKNRDTKTTTTNEKPQTSPAPAQADETVDVDNWEIEYED